MKPNVANKIISHALRFVKPIDQIRILITDLFKIKLIKIVTVVVLVLCIAPFVFFVIAAPKPPKVFTYGVNFSNRYATELGLDWKYTYSQILTDLKVKNLRVAAYWDDIEPQKGIFNFSDTTWQLDQADKYGTNVILAIGRKVPRYPECFEPKWWKETQSEQQRNEDLYKYIQTAVATLKNHKSIKMWQVENEPFFTFGSCLPTSADVVKNEIQIVKTADSRPVLIQDSGEGGFWLPSYKLADYLGISMYRKVWHDFYGILLGKHVYIQYPLSYWTYKIKADLVHVPYQKIIITELQAEPWGPESSANLTQEEKDKTMSRQDFISITSYAQKTGFKDLYFWGAEWWLFQKQKFNENFYWDTAKALFN